MDNRQGIRTATDVASATHASTGASKHAAGPRRADDSDSDRAEVQRATALGVWIWPAFSLLDFYMCFLLYPDASIWECLLMRVTCQMLFMAAYWCARRPAISVLRARQAYIAAIDVCALFIGTMAVNFGGLDSVYMHGLSVVMLVVALCLPDRGRVGLMTLAPVALSYPVVMGVAALFDPSIAFSWTDARQLLVFGSNYTFVVAMMIIGALTGHFIWAARQELYQARKLGRYRLEAPIGQGGMNQVWLAWDAALERNVALKILRSLGVDGAVIRRFEREAKAASQLTSPHTIRIFDFGASDDGLHYIAMEHLRGADLAKLVELHGPMPPARVVHFAVQACASLAEAHAAGIVHRDIKPHNLFVINANGDPDFLKLLDFGIASRMENSDETKLTRTGALTGTPLFMAPEIIRGMPADARTDLYGLGATLYFLLTGTPPFNGDLRSVILAHVLDAPEAPSMRGVQIPATLEQIVMRCLAKQPDERFQSAAQLAAALDSAECGPWTPGDAQRFWEQERAHTLARWAEPTLVDSMPATQL